MSDFYSNLKNTQTNVSYTENGMQGYKTTNNPLVDFNFKISSYRSNARFTEALNDFNVILKSGEKYVLRYLMYLRDIREGVGERALFRLCMLALLDSKEVTNKENIVNALLTYIPVYGRYDDLLTLIMQSDNKEITAKTVDFIKNQLKTDFENYQNNKPISLLAKWMPSENASSAETKKAAKTLIKSLQVSPKVYRKTLSTLREYLNIVERKACAGEWEDIDYNTVPSKANMKYMNAFLKHDEARRRQHLAKILAGDKSVKTHMDVTYPYEIIAQYVPNANRIKEYDESLEAYWSQLPECAGLKDTIIVADTSGSMTWNTVAGTKSVYPIHISLSLAMYCAQYGQSEFKDKFITFADKAELVDLSKCGSIHSKLQRMTNANVGMSTNISSVFNLILNTAIDNDMKQEEIPSTIMIVSDMEFNQSESYGGRDEFSTSNAIKDAEAKFAAHGYKIPKLVFWNTSSRTETLPSKDKNGVLLVSGFSPRIVSLIMNGADNTYDALIKQLDSDRYSEVPFVTFKTDEKTVSVTENKTTNTNKKIKIKTQKVAIPDFLK